MKREKAKTACRTCGHEPHQHNQDTRHCGSSRKPCKCREYRNPNWRPQ